MWKMKEGWALGNEAILQESNPDDIYCAMLDVIHSSVLQFTCL